MIEAFKRAIARKDEPKAMFEEATRCPDCNSDAIYVFQDSDGGLCTKCKAILTGIIKGGLSKMEVMRLRGDLKGVAAEATLNDRDRKAEAAAQVNADVAKLKQDVAGLGKSQAMPSVKDTPKTPQRETVKGPSVIEKAKAWLFKGDKDKAAEPPKAAPPPPPAVKKAELPPPPKLEPKETGLPCIGDRWSVGPCAKCGLSSKRAGFVSRSKTAGTSTRFIELADGSYGCFFCSKKA
jgi:hypothetical protein